MSDSIVSTHPDTRTPPPAPPAWLLRALGVIVLLQILTILRYAGPTASSVDAPVDTFSAGRALQVLDRLVGNGRPHPVASAEHPKMRDRVRAEFTRLGYDTQVQETFACNPRGSCADVENIVARLAGTGDGAAILLAAHYDSVPPGPGASDDGQGVAAILEVARILKTLPSARNDVIFLITDAEERGLIGAYGFAADHAWMQDVRVVLNIEARGSRGPSLMFETGPDSAGLVRMMGSHASRPITNSLLSAIYERMPNGSDFTVFKDRGIPGMNYGFVGGWPHYHTPIDDIAHLDPRSLQHHGDNVLAATRALLNEPLTFADGDAVYFDLFGYGVVCWSTTAAWLIAVGALVPPLLTVRMLRRRNELTTRQVLGGAGICVLMLVGAALGGGLIVRILARLRDVTAPWTAYPFPTWLALFAVSFGAGGVIAAAVGRRAGAWAIHLGGAALLALLGIVLMLVVPGASYLATVPVWVAGLVALVAAGLGRSPVGPALAAAVTLACLFLPVARGAQDAMGLQVSVLQTGPYGLIAAALAPIVVLAGSRERRIANRVAAGAVGIGLLAALVIPHHTPYWPARMNIEFHQDAAAGSGRWLVMADGVPLPDAMQDVARFADDSILPFPFSNDWSAAYVAPAEGLDAPGPELTVLEDTATPEGGRRLRVEIRSPRGAPSVTLLVSPEAAVTGAWINGREIEPLDDRAAFWMNGWRFYMCHTVGPTGFEVLLTLDSPALVDVILRDDLFELPPGGEALSAARPDWAGPQHSGDQWTMTRRMQL